MGPDPQRGRSNFCGCLPHWKALGDFAAMYAIMAEPIEMLFVGWLLWAYRPMYYIGSRSDESISCCEERELANLGLVEERRKRNRSFHGTIDSDLEWPVMLELEVYFRLHEWSTLLWSRRLRQLSVVASACFRTRRAWMAKRSPVENLTTCRRLSRPMPWGMLACLPASSLPIRARSSLTYRQMAKFQPW